MDATIIKLWKNYHVIANLLFDAMGGEANIVGKFAEKLVADYYDGKQLPPSSKSADIVLTDGVTLQVKARVPRQAMTTSLGIIRTWDFDYLVVVLFSTDGAVAKAVEVDAETARNMATFNKLQNGWVITTTREFLEHPSAYDITDQLNGILGGKGRNKETAGQNGAKTGHSPTHSVSSNQQEEEISDPIHPHPVIETRKRPGESFQDFVKRTLTLMFDKNLIPPKELALLQTKDYSKKTFGLEYSLLQSDSTKLQDRMGRNRYWTKYTLGGRYYVCSQWWKDKFGIYEPLFEKWIRYAIFINHEKRREEAGSQNA
jgi:hypothetical protein